MAMAYITFTGVSDGPCDRFHNTQRAANARALDNSEIVAHVGILDIGKLQPRHAYFNGTAVVSDEVYRTILRGRRSNDTIIEERRAYLIGLLQGHESIGAKLAVWHGSNIDDLPEGDPPEAGEDDERLDKSKRTPSYGRWVEANTRAMLVDENLTTLVKWTWLKAECEIPGETWYWQHKVNGTATNGGWYEIYANNDRSEWDWHYTGTGTDSNSRSGIKPTMELLLTLNVTADWIKELQ